MTKGNRSTCPVPSFPTPGRSPGVLREAPPFLPLAGNAADLKKARFNLKVAGLKIIFIYIKLLYIQTNLKIRGFALKLLDKPGDKQQICGLLQLG
ncbi:MAG: hypothetical protein EOO59_11650 [Hymenobacter sp.]|nr:MAG: hypothetical protein EOO59_11650 [Hymenobacter sp.]